MLTFASASGTKRLLNQTMVAGLGDSVFMADRSLTVAVQCTAQSQGFAIEVEPGLRFHQALQRAVDPSLFEHAGCFQQRAEHDDVPGARVADAVAELGERLDDVVDV